MAKHRYYYYDHETCEFVELKNRRRRFRVQLAAIGSAALFLAIALTWGMDHLVETPQELALRAENEALQQQIENFSQRIQAVSGELEKLAQDDQNLYRSLLQAEPIPDDVRQVGVGGADAYTRFDRFSYPTAQALRVTSEQLDRLELQLGLQRDSFSELRVLAAEHERQLGELPAIVPTNGTIVSGYGLRYHPILRVRRMHYGVDIHVRTGTPVVSAADGRIKEVGRGNGYGLFVKVEHPTSGYVTLYAHLSRVPSGIVRGRKVARGELIAFSGNSGLSSSPHLHYEVRDLDNRALNPVQFFAPTMTPAAYQKLLAETEATEVSFD